jgi:hypothetical protein
VIIGPLTLWGLGGLGGGDQAAHSLHNADGWHYRVDTEVRGPESVTITIGAEQRARAGLEYGSGYSSAPVAAVTFHGCPGDPTIFVGAFFVSGDGRACVPLDIRVDGGATQRVMISFFHGRCSA